jgi:hypothetical protein
LSGQFQIRGKSGLVPRVAVIMRFDARDHRADVHSRYHLVAQDLGQIGVVSRPHGEAELEMLRADPSDVQGGQVARRADRKLQIEVRQHGVGRMRIWRSERNQACVPSRGVVVLRVEAL